MKIYVVTQSHGEYDDYGWNIIDMFQNRKDAEICAAYRDKETLFNKEEAPMTIDEYYRLDYGYSDEDNYTRVDKGGYTVADFEKMDEEMNKHYQGYHPCKIEEWEVK